jgi:hypothetical protein
MARLIFQRAAITAATNSTATTATNINSIVTESITMSEEALQVAIEDNQNYNEGYTTALSFRTLQSKAENGSTNIAEPSDNTSLTFCGGSSVLAKKRLTMFGVNGGDDYYVDNVYVMGRRVFENGREEYEISCQFDSTKLEIVKA